MTATAISEDAFASSGRVYVATGLNFPDALAGAAAAGWWDEPVLLVPGATSIDVVPTEIDRLGAHRLFVLGGTSAVSSEVESQLALHVTP